MGNNNNNIYNSIWGPDIDMNKHMFNHFMMINESIQSPPKEIHLIIGVGGQDGQALSSFLLSLGHRVIGVARRSSQPRNYLTPLITKGLEIVEGDVTDVFSLYKIFSKYKPDYIYNLSAQSHVGSSFSQPSMTWDVVATGVLNVLETMREVCPQARFYQASSSEMFGSNYSVDEESEGLWETKDYNIKDGFLQDHLKKANKEYNRTLPFQDEYTPFRPESPYAIAKLAGHHTTRLYRESYGLFASTGILFNHEGIYRGINFLTRKITNYVSRLWLAKREGKKIERLGLGNLDAYRDWSDAEDMVQAMYLILKHDKADDFVIGSGETHTVREFCEEAFGLIGENFEHHVAIFDSLKRPSEVPYLRANPEKAKKELGWKQKSTFKDLVKEMVDHDIDRTMQKFQVYGDI